VRSNSTVGRRDRNHRQQRRHRHALAEALSVEGRPVRLIEHSPSLTCPDRSISADVRDVSALSAAVAGCTTLYHLARAHRTTFGRSSGSRRQCDGAAHACAVAETHGIGRIVFVSSVAVNGLAAGELDEDAPLRPGSDYGRSRQEAEQVFRGWAARAPERSLTIVPPPVAAKGEGNGT
jgi:nucleoside-diphosphate-sugar epimerase